MRRRIISIGLAVSVVAAGVAADPHWIARGREGMVASDSPEASRIAAEVLRAGGNAFDAAIACSLALSVSRPQSTGLGGGGFLVAYLADRQRAIALDFRETAPGAATPERFIELRQTNDAGPSPSIYGGNAVAVPGLLAGLAEIHRHYASRPWSELVMPAAELAANGFAVDEAYRSACAEALRNYEKWPELKTRCGHLHRTLLNDGRLPQTGQIVRRPDLADALRLIAREGPAIFYDGPIGQAIVAAVRKDDGPLTMDDLRSYRVRRREPLRAPFGQHVIVSMPPPSSGGACVVEALNVLECLARRHGGICELGQRGELAAPLARAFQHAFADRARWFGDPDFTEIPIARLIDRDYACRLADKPAGSLDDFGSTTMPDDGGTSHFCVVDRWGNVVSMTETVNGTFGSLIIAEPYGILLNNQMDDFLIVPGEANLYGLRQSEANLVGPGKRPLSSMSPTIVFREGRPVLVLGASGGPRIITAVAQVLINVLELDQSLEQAVAAPRLHQQWQPDEVYFDQPPCNEVAAALQNAGFKISGERRKAVVNAVQLLPDGTMVGVSDPRKGGRPVAADVPSDGKWKRGSIR